MIQLYWKNATTKAMKDADPAHFITPGELASISERMNAAQQAVAAQVAAGQLGYAKLPARTDYRDSVMELVRRRRPVCTDLVVLGIGGSALGNIAVQTALNPPTYNLLSNSKRKGPRLFVLDNVDPAMIKDMMNLLGRRLSTTTFNVISKSGETAETASQFMIFRGLLAKRLGQTFAHHIVATTDAMKGLLNRIARRDGYETLVVPDDVGGRFSVLSPVGLFSAAMCNIDIDAMLAGAAAMADRCANDDWAANPAAMLAAIKYLMYATKGKPIHVMMPYSNRLYLLADWYRQLWAESLGKRVNRAGEEVFVGPTPIKALGTTDQHSQVQLYREGPNDKLTVFLEVNKHPRDVRIPDVFAEMPGLSYLRKKRLSTLLAAQKTATEYAMACSNRPSVTIRFPEITPQAVGEFFYLYEYATSLMGELLDINAYDQPAVELGKQATFALMGREGYEDLAREIRPFTRVKKTYLV